MNNWLIFTLLTYICGVAIATWYKGYRKQIDRNYDYDLLFSPEMIATFFISWPVIGVFSLIASGIEWVYNAGRQAGYNARIKQLVKEDESTNR